ncbi:hypothetical protein [Streptomyces sp. NBC_01422]|uniref:hypothetical protein n=1 Tax=Streptomyces sp. NBC_01422 TaxID=2903859 RepID=UPI002E27B28F|nr:hypothetical protein [Streptomyces sp. NBC_01422]
MKMPVIAVSVLALGGLLHTPAQATGTADDGPVGIGVIGSGLKVREVRITLDGWKAGAKARVSEWNSTEYVRSVRGWKAMSSKEFRGHKFETAIWKINKNVPHGHRICAEVAGYEERMPCVTIKR